MICCKEHQGGLGKKLELCFDAVPEGPGRFPEAYPEAYFELSYFAAVPEGPGRFLEAYLEAYFNC